MIRQDTDYAFRLLLCLGTKHPAAVGTRDAIRQTHVPPAFAYKVLRRLADAGILTARTGRGGGYALSKPASQVRMWDVVETVQGALSVSLCTDKNCACNLEDACKVSGAWRSLQRQVFDFLSSTTLSDLLASKPGSDTRHSGRRNRWKQEINAVRVGAQ